MKFNNLCEYRTYKNRAFAIDQRLTKESDGLYLTEYILIEVNPAELDTVIKNWGVYDNYVDCVNGVLTIVDCNFH